MANNFKLYEVDINLDQNQLLSPVIENRTSDPSTPIEGQIYYDSGSGQKCLKLFTGTNFEALMTDIDSGSMVTKTDTASAAGIIQISAGADRTIEDYLIDGIVMVSESIARAAIAGSEYTTPDGVENLTNKTFDNTNTLTIIDGNFTIQDDGDNTSQAQFDCSLIPTGSLNTYQLPAASGRIALYSESIHRFGLSFNNTTDWVGPKPYTFTVTQVTHGLLATEDLMVQVKDDSNPREVVEVNISTATSGDVVLTTNKKFAGRILIFG